MTEDLQDKEIAEALEKGHDLLQKGNYREALLQFEKASTQDPIRQEGVQGLQMAGVTLRLMHWLAGAAVYLSEALKQVDSIDDARLKAAIHRDQGAVFYEQSLVYRKQHPDAISPYTPLADNAFMTSLVLLYEELKKDLSEEEYGRIEAEIAVTKGFRGMLFFDMRVRYDYAEARWARQLVEQADSDLRALGDDFQVYQLNNLIRLMRVSYLVDRFSYLDRALTLTNRTSDSPGSRKRVYAAMFGNRIYRLLSKHG